MKSPPLHAPVSSTRSLRRGNSAIPAARILETVVPNDRHRRLLATALADSIVEAHATAPGSWSLTAPSDEMVRLNVGPLQAVIITDESAGFMVDAGSLKQGKLALPSGVTLSRAGDYRSVPTARLLLAPPPDFAKLREQFDEAHVAFLRDAAMARKGSSWRSSHSAALLNEVAKLVDRRLPSPDYTTSSGGAVAEQDDAAFFAAREGLVVYRRHRSRERDAKLVNLKKTSVMKRTGRLACEVCGFDFSAVYGPLGDGFAECHHTAALSTYRTAGGTTTLRDLAIVCPNCHRMLHRSRPWSGVEGLRDVVAKRGAEKLDP